MGNDHPLVATKAHELEHSPVREPLGGNEVGLDGAADAVGVLGGEHYSGNDDHGYGGHRAGK
jgi:hypothetical protein